MTINHYADNNELLNEFRKSKKRKEENPKKDMNYWVTPRLSYMYLSIVERLLTGSKYCRNGSNYLMEMESQALFEFSRYALSFPDKPPHNIFAYYTNMAKRAFGRALKREKTQENVLEKLKAETELTMIAGYAKTESINDVENGE